MLMRHVLDKADQNGERCYLESSPAGVSLYQRFGFEEKDRINVLVNGENYWNQCMVREPKR